MAGFWIGDSISIGSDCVLADAPTALYEGVEESEETIVLIG